MESFEDQNLNIEKVAPRFIRSGPGVSKCQKLRIARTLVGTNLPISRWIVQFSSGESGRTPCFADLRVSGNDDWQSITQSPRGLYLPRILEQTLRVFSAPE